MPLSESHPNDLLWGLSRRELELVQPCLSRRQFAANEVILRRGDPGDCLYVVESGLVVVETPDGPEGRRVLAQLGPGQMFGEMAILTGQPRSAQVRAVVETHVLTLSLSDFFSVAGHSPTMLLNIGRILASRLGQMTRTSIQRDRRAIVVLVGAVSPIVGSLIATNLAAGIAYVSGRRAVLFDQPPDRAARLPGREYAPALADATGGPDLLLTLSRLEAGPLTMHVFNMDSTGEDNAQAVGKLTTIISQIRREAEFAVVNLTGASSAYLDAVLPLATDVRVVTTSSGLESDAGLKPLLERVRRSAPTTASIGSLLLSSDGATPAMARTRARYVLGVENCLVMPGQVDLLRDAAVTQPPAVLHNHALPSSRAYAVLARTIAGLRVGLALGSGAAKGVAHVGVLAALGRLGVPVDCVTGTSIGALVGSGVALGMDIRQVDETMGRLVDLWAEALRPTLPRFSLVSSKGLDRIVKELTGDVRFDELPIPFGAVATDLNSGRSVNICAGSVALAVRASISIPLIFPPVFDGSYCLVDGFVTNPIPTKLARDLGGDVILAVNLGRPPDDDGLSPIQYEERARGDEARRQSAPNILETYLRCADIMMTGRGENDCLSADLAFRPRLPQISWREFQKGGPAMDAGEAAVEESKDALRELLPWLKHGG